MSRNDDRQLAVLLACFADAGAASKARKPLEAKLKSAGDVMLDTTVVKVSAKHKASLHDPRRVAAGTLTAGFTWGLFGLVTGGWLGAVIWAVLGALCGGGYAYYGEHLETKAELANLGARLPARSSALLTFAETSDPRRLLAFTADHTPSAASIAAIGDDLSAHVFAGASNPIEVSRSSGAQGLLPDQATAVDMIMVRYAAPDTAKQVASRIVKANGKSPDATQVDLVVETDGHGRRHTHTPKLGLAAMTKSDIVSWGAFGVLAGAISGAINGGIVKSGVVTGIGWAVFGAFAGSLYGLWVGRSISGRRLKGVGPLLAPGTSMLLVWGKGDDERTVDVLSAPNSQRLVLRFNAVEHGALIEAA
jgi:uncharacterized membrane protein